MPDVTTVLSSMLSSVVWALIGVILLFVGFRIFDAADPVAYHDEIRKGNVAAGVVAAGLMIGLSIIIYGAIR